MTIVLLVDDQPFVAAAVQQLLAGEQDVELHYCSQPSDAIAMANTVGPAVILQDLVMPDADGLALVEAYRANPRTAATTIVVLSGNDDDLLKRSALSRGANDYLVKLPSKEQLIASIRRQTHAAAPVPQPSGDPT